MEVPSTVSSSLMNTVFGSVDLDSNSLGLHSPMTGTLKCDFSQISFLN